MSMSDPTLHQLEREVEAARAKLAGDLSTLRSPATYSEFTSDLKNDALDVKDALVDQAKSSVQSTIEGLVDDLKARAAANPAAALAIGAGIAWRLIQRPPIATALVGAGLYSLFRTNPIQPAQRTTEGYLSLAKDRLGQQASNFAEGVKERAVAVGEAATEKTAELAASVKDRAMAMGEAVTEKATELAGAATDQAQHWSDEMRSSARRVAGDATRAAGNATDTLEELRQSSMRAAEQAASRATAISDEWTRPLQEVVGNEEARDKFLLGAAGVAVIAALSIACQRRFSEPAGSD
jgi:hypothetical protein